MSDAVLFEDDFCTIELGNAAEGHLKVIPKKDVHSLHDLSDEEVSRYFFTSSFAATVIFESLGVQGTNIVFHSTGEVDKLTADILPRTFEDNIAIQWKPMEANPDEFADIATRIRDAGDEPPAAGEKPKALKQEKTLDEEDYRVKHWDRLP